MTTLTFELSLESGFHHHLQLFEGSWEGMMRTWFEADNLADLSPVKGTIRSVLGGRFLLHEYKGSFGGKPIEGIALYGYSLSTGAFQSAWVDSYHMGTGIIFSEAAAADHHFNVLGRYEAGNEVKEIWGWRTEIQPIHENEITITAYNISPDGVETKAVETIYHRQK